MSHTIMHSLKALQNTRALMYSHESGDVPFGFWHLPYSIFHIHLQHIHTYMIHICLYTSFFFLFPRLDGLGCPGQFTRTLTDFFPGPVNTKLSTPDSGGLYEKLSYSLTPMINCPWPSLHKTIYVHTCITILGKLYLYLLGLAFVCIHPMTFNLL